MRYRSFFLVITMCFASTVFSQGNNNSNTKDLSTVDGVIHTLYEVISGPAGEVRNWNLFRLLFAPEARMYIAVPDKNNTTALKMITPEQYVERNKTRLADIGFNEQELYRITNSYGAGTQIFSTYESHFTNKDGVEEIIKGINNIQLYFNGERYFIVSIFWDADAKNIQVPERYLPKNKNTEYQIDL
jgi:hypothetical protein